MKRLRLGAGAGYSGDRIEPAIELAEKGDIAYLVFECLAERTIALAQQARLRDPAAGFDPLLAARMQAVLAPCRDRGIKIITNMGAANPLAAAAKTRDIAHTLGLDGLHIVAVTGDDVAEIVRAKTLGIADKGCIGKLGEALISANAYLGAEPIARALSEGADVVITGRAADPSLFLAPIVMEFGWAWDDWPKLGRGTLVGHLLECAGQITGGYFADPGVKDIAGLARLGFPIAEVDEDGNAVITKVDGSGGAVTEATCKEQLLYEIHDPARYLTPDVVADFSRVEIAEQGRDRVAVRGASGTARPSSLKVSVGYHDSFIGEGQISYAGPGAAERGRLALDIVCERLRLIGVAATETRFDLIGIDALHGAALSAAAQPYEVRARVAARTRTMAEAARIGDEVEALYTNGPAGGGGVVKSAREIVGVASAFLARDLVTPQLHHFEA